jgi:hypothetical protein
MCPNTDCTIRRQCYRSPESGTYGGAPNQRWCDFLFGKVACEAYVPITGAPAAPVVEVKDMFGDRPAQYRRRS